MEKVNVPFFIESTTLRNQLNNHKARDQFQMHMGNQQGALSCTSNLCLQGIIKADRQNTRPRGEVASLVQGKKKNTWRALEMFISTVY